MSYTPHPVPTPWQPKHSPLSDPSAYASRIDGVRLTRLGILMALIGFWASVFMALF